MTDKKFADRLAKAMQDSGFTQAALAKGAGVSQPAVSRWLDGATPSLAVGIRLSTILNVAHEWLIGGLDLPPEIKFTDEMRRRLIFARHKEGLEISEVASRAGWPEETFAAVENGARVPSMRTLAVLSDVLNVEERWVLEGRGKMFKSESSFVLVPPREWDKGLAEAKEAKARADFLLYRAERLEWEIAASEEQVKAAREYRPTILRKGRKRHRWNQPGDGMPDLQEFLFDNIKETVR